MTTAPTEGGRTGPKAFNLEDLELKQVRQGFSRHRDQVRRCRHHRQLVEAGYTTVGPHSHPFDQLSYVTAGAMRFYVGDEVFDLTAPAVLHIPGGVPHLPALGRGEGPEHRCLRTGP